MHGAAGVHSQTVGHARAGATVAGTASTAVAGGPRVVTWKKKAHVDEPIITETLHRQCQWKSKTWVAVSLDINSPLEFDRLLRRLTQNSCHEIP